MIAGPDFLVSHVEAIKGFSRALQRNECSGRMCSFAALLVPFHMLFAANLVLRINCSMSVGQYRDLVIS